MSEISTLVRKYVDRYNSGDVEGMLALCHDDVVFETVASLGGEMRIDGKDDMRDILIATTRAFRGRSHKIISLISEADRAAAETMFSGVATAELAHDVREGDTVSIRGVTVFERRDDKFVRISDYS
ncbi:nuclear transport factor 2 family protein [bacterium]|nr:nuclear transport factor 2 family protein [bacterium]